MTMDDMLIELFREDAVTQLEALAGAIVEAESAADPAPALTICMRAAHSLKGAARVVGLDTIVDVAHAMEDGFEAARLGRIRLDPSAWDRLLDAIDRIRQLAGMDGGEGQPADAPAVATLLDDLRAIGRGEAVGAAHAAAGAAAGADAAAADIPAPDGRQQRSQAGPHQPGDDAPTAATLAVEPPGKVAEERPGSSQPDRTQPASDDHGAARSAASAAGSGAIKVSPEVISRLMSLSAEVSVQLRQLERQVDRLGGIGRTLDRTSTLLRPIRELAGTDRGVATGVGEQRPQHRWVGQEENAPRVEQNRIEVHRRHEGNLLLARAQPS